VVGFERKFLTESAFIIFCFPIVCLSLILNNRFGFFFDFSQRFHNSIDAMDFLHVKLPLTQASNRMSVCSRQSMAKHANFLDLLHCSTVLSGFTSVPEISDPQMLSAFAASGD
jgi:hypothetical protein